MGFEFLDLEIKDLILGDSSNLCAVKTLSYKQNNTITIKFTLMYTFYGQKKLYCIQVWFNLLFMKSTGKIESVNMSNHEKYWYVYMTRNFDGRYCSVKT